MNAQTRNESVIALENAAALCTMLMRPEPKSQATARCHAAQVRDDCRAAAQSLRDHYPKLDPQG